MFGILILYFIARPFARLAVIKDKNKWLWGISSILVYYAGSFLGGIIIALVMQNTSQSSIEDMDNILIGVLAMPFGLLLAWLYYKFLERQWKKEEGFQQQDILDENINIPN